MANIDGSWNTVTKSPMGDQAATLTIRSSGDSFTGSYASPMGSLDIKDGQVNGDTLNWSLETVVPMPMTLTCTATVDGDTMTGSVTAGGFGSFPMTGTRA